MLRSLFTGATGLINHQTRMDTVGNNIANVNTTGFKSGRTTFADLFSQTLQSASSSNGNMGGTNAKQIGLGVALASVDTIFTNGSVQTTGKNTDLALSGAGLFVVNKNGKEYYTRNGDFEFDSEGNLVMAGTGYKVQGWMASDDGTVSAGGGATDIVIKSEESATTETATETTAVTETSGDTEISGETEISDTTGKKGKQFIIAAKATQNAVYSLNLDASNNTTPVDAAVSVYDAKGDTLTLPVVMTKSGANQWTASLSSTTIENEDGTVTNLSMEPVTVSFTAYGAYDDTAGKQNGTLTLTGDDGTTQTVNLDFSALTQYAGSSTITGTADGNEEGLLESVSADNSGYIIGNYSNGMSQTLAQVAVATFRNSAGLTKVGGSLYQTSNNSGEAQLDTAEKSASTITPGALEMSNVDLSTEFSDMIITQRGFQANSKVITVSDEILETAINTKR